MAKSLLAAALQPAYNTELRHFPPPVSTTISPSLALPRLLDPSILRQVCGCQNVVWYGGYGGCAGASNDPEPSYLRVSKYVRLHLTTPFQLNDLPLSSSS